MSILNIPIQINGGAGAHATNANKAGVLKDRELYINTSSHYLYCGVEDSQPFKINAGHSDTSNESKSLVNFKNETGLRHSSYLLRHQKNDSGDTYFQGRLGSVAINMDGLTKGTETAPIVWRSTNDDDSRTAGYTTSLSHFIVHKPKLRLVNELTVKRNLIYGTTLPDNPTEGQIFFKI